VSDDRSAERGVAERQQGGVGLYERRLARGLLAQPGQHRVREVDADDPLACGDEWDRYAAGADADLEGRAVNRAQRVAKLRGLRRGHLR